MGNLYTNDAKKRLLAGEKLSATWLQLGNTLSAEIMAQSGFDIAVIDSEHSPIDPTNLIPIFQSIGAYPCMKMVRAPWNELVIIKRILDCGADAIHIPYVNTKEEAEYAIQACKYPPLGRRGIAGSPRACGYGGNIGQYLQRANDEILVMLAIETPEAADNLEALCQVEGVDGIFIGPMDMSTTMGYFANPNHEVVQAKIRELEKVILGAGKLMGTVAPNVEAAKELYKRGYSYVIFASDSIDLANGARKSIKEFADFKNSEI